MTINREIKMWYVYIYREYYSAIKRNETGSSVEIWMAIEFTIQTEVRKTNIVY